MKFRKKPVVIEAEQYKGPAEIAPGPTAGDPAAPAGVEWCRDGGDSVRPYVVTLEGRMLVTPGDWIITGVKGKRYPCKPDIFEATYEAVDAHSARPAAPKGGPG